MTTRLPLLLAGCAAALMLGTSTLALADCVARTAGSSSTTSASASTQGKEVQIVQETVDNAKKDAETGQTEASTGPAKPVETWLACKPGQNNDQCTNKGLSEKGKEQEAEAATKPKGDGATAGSTTSSGAMTAADAKTATSNKLSQASGVCVEDQKKSG